MGIVFDVEIEFINVDEGGEVAVRHGVGNEGEDKAAEELRSVLLEEGFLGVDENDLAGLQFFRELQLGLLIEEHIAEGGVSEQ